VDAPEKAQACADVRGAPYMCGLASKDALAKKVGAQVWWAREEGGDGWDALGELRVRQGRCAVCQSTP
jgi:endonuclease YncB( thermonuclease family)